MPDTTEGTAAFNRAVTNWLIRENHATAHDTITNLDIDVAQDGWCETCGNSYSVDIDYRVNGKQAPSISIAPYNLGAWIGGLL